MKTGYSMLLGEYIDAEVISYTDCKSFQIVCPICREPIFKVERKQPSNTLHYLSHYETSKAIVSDCELRVTSITDFAKKQENSQSRGQKLEYFLSVLREEILKRELGANSQNIQKINQEITRWMKSPGVHIFRDMLYEHLHSNNEMSQQENLSVCFDEYVKDIEFDGGKFPVTGFAIATQKRIATDIWLFLLSAKALENFTFLFCMGLGMLSERISLASKERPLHQFEKDFMIAINQLIDIDREKAIGVLKRLIDTSIGPPFAIIGSNYLSKLSSEILFEMLGILLRLPYFEILAKRK